MTIVVFILLFIFWLSSGFTDFVSPDTLMILVGFSVMFWTLALYYILMSFILNNFIWKQSKKIWYFIFVIYTVIFIIFYFKLMNSQ